MAPAADEDAVITQPPDGVVVPPKDVRRVVEKSASYAVRRGEEFERRLVDNSGKHAQLHFVHPDDPYNAYYQWRKKEISEGRGYPDESGNIPTAVTKKAPKGPAEPPAFEFSVKMPNISAMDLEVIKLTALFVAIKGTPWLTKFSQMYGQQVQFSFLRPQFGLHQLFQRLQDQYRELLSADGGELAARQKRRIEELERNAEDKYKLLDKAKARAEWVKYQEATKVKEQEKDEAERLAYQQIDWHKFEVLATIEFTAKDEQVDLPRPMTLNDIQSASLETKNKISVPAGMRLEEAFPDDSLFAQPPQQQYRPMHQSVSPMPPPPQQQYYQPQYPQQHQQFAPPPSYTPAQAADEGDNSAIAERQQEAERAAAARAAAAGTGPMRIVDNYVPRAQARRQNAATSICPFCNQAIPNDEYEKHVRIEQLDPRWREQTRIAQQRSATTNLSTADVANNLKRLASQRSDVFDPVTGRQIDARDAKRVDTGAQQAPAPGQVGAVVNEARSTDVQEQLRQLQSKYGAPPQG